MAKRSKQTAKSKHLVDDLFEKKIKRNAREASESKEQKDRERLGPRRRLTKLLFNAVKKEQRGRHISVRIPDNVMAEELERLLKTSCRRYGLENPETKNNE
jgi:hypothetical protein